MNMPRFRWALVTGCMLLWAGNPLTASDLDVEELQSRIFRTVEQVSPAVVSVTGRGSAFSGVIVSEEGHVLSAGHTVRPGSQYRVTLPDGRRFTARGMGASDALDCGLVRIENPDNLPTVVMGNSANLKTNQPCLSLSFPGGTQGRREPVARFGRIVLAKTRRGMIQSTALMEPGDSGGALFDLNGNLIGVHSRIGRSEKQNFDVPVNTFKDHWTQLNQAESFSSGPPLPRLGFEGEERDDKDGILVISLVDGGVASAAGLQVNDVIVKIDDRETRSIRAFRNALVAARDAGNQRLKINVLRDDRPQKLTVPFRTTVRKPETPPALLTVRTPEPVAVAQLANLAAEFSELESDLDDCCVVVKSQMGGGTTTICATRLADSRLLVSKSSMVGSQPAMAIDGVRFGLDVVARDPQNDLVLLRAADANPRGIRLASDPDDDREIGEFLLSPDPGGAGLVSVVSTSEFTSRKRQSRGYLGVLLTTWQDNQGVVLQEVQEGAARRAGLQAGDVIVQMNDRKIAKREDILQFLSSVDPRTRVTARVIRDKQQMDKPITLGAPPQQSNHAADMMDKSGRRDGFTRVLAHDAVLKPSACGGPLFDLEGDFAGINIARFSRVRSYAIPPATVREFVERHRQ